MPTPTTASALALPGLLSRLYKSPSPRRQLSAAPAPAPAPADPAVLRLAAGDHPLEVGAGAVVHVVPVPPQRQHGLAVVAAVSLELVERLDERADQTGAQLPQVLRHTVHRGHPGGVSEIDNFLETFSSASSLTDLLCLLLHCWTKDKYTMNSQN